ncbi:hypothetical protein CJD36_002200 [Flavipsychrobacter stenotrophus]|uniref:DUF2019 domain-containing protein n=1 Tax=Flavipsychrobacter stenotrophus TaxID=2077091 RepID=A0A2S7T066_9BACT|nr:hypothetical protein [Flavipsychrobacter stenotrophus]PQJ12580.1 hypothetical protein CJD36_002200 [Flavipsychrobacter stenotrophus]
MKNIIDKEEALATFEDAANGHGEATEQGNYKLGNICYNKIILAVTFLKENNGIPLLLPFLRHDSIGVRIWAASYLL